MLFAEVYSAVVDADKKPITGSDGFDGPDQLLFFTAMAAMRAGARTSRVLRNEGELCSLTTAKQLRAGVNQAECLD